MVAGKSLVIVPAINLDRKYTGDEAVNEKKWAFRTDVTATTIWQNKANARDVIRVGPDEPFNEVGLHGYVSTFVAGNAQYFVYIVNPGTYTVAGNTYETTANAMSQLGTQQKPGRSPLGQIALLPKKNTDFIQSQEWFNAQFRDREVTDTYCSSVFVQSGGCAFWATEKRTVSEMTGRGMEDRHPGEVRRRAGGLDPAQARICFVQRRGGEAIVIDGLYPTPPNADYDKQACEIVSGQIQCDLTRYTLTRIPADMARAGRIRPGVLPARHAHPVQRQVSPAQAPGQAGRTSLGVRSGLFARRAVSARPDHRHVRQNLKRGLTQASNNRIGTENSMKPTLQHIACVALLFTAASAHAIDCQKAGNRVEHTICADENSRSPMRKWAKPIRPSCSRRATTAKCARCWSAVRSAGSRATSVSRTRSIFPAHRMPRPCARACCRRSASAPRP